MSIDNPGYEGEEGKIPPLESDVVPPISTPEPSAEPDKPKSYAEVIEESESAQINPREEYAKALRSQSKVFFGRASKKELDERRQEYHSWISSEIQKEIEEIKNEFGEIPSDPAREAELNAKITELVLTHQAEEENSLMMSMEDPTKETGVQKFQKFWKQNAKTRLIIGGALLGGVAVSTLTGQFGVAAGLQALRTPMSGVGGTMTIESLADIARNKFGDTKEIQDKDISSIDDDELLRRLAAHETSFTDMGKSDGVFGVKSRGVFKKHQDETGNKLLAEFKSRRESGFKNMVQEMQEEGKTSDQIVKQLLEINFSENAAHNEALENQRASDRKFAVTKWTVAAVGGGVLAALSGLSALGQAKKAAVLGHDMVSQAATTGVKTAVAHSDAVHGPIGPDSTGSDTAHHATTVNDTLHSSVAADTTASDTTHHATSVGDTLHTSAAADSSHHDVAGAQPDSVGSHVSDAGPSHTPDTTVAEAVDVNISAVETVKKGDSVWKIVERQLHERMGKQFDDLDSARKTFMINALKGKISANPSEFGLTDVDHLSIGQQLDLSHVFAGQNAVHLDTVHQAAVGLDQHAVSSILEHNNQLHEWVQAHPHEALTSGKVEEILSGLTKVTTADGQSIASEAGDKFWVEHVMTGTRERMLCDLAERFPAEYIKAHADNPDMYPAVAGVTDIGSTTDMTTNAVEGGYRSVIYLSSAGLEAKQHYLEVVHSTLTDGSKADAEAIVQHVSKMTAAEIMKKGFVEKTIDEMQGGTLKDAKKIASAARKILKMIPNGEYLKSDKFGQILARIPEVKK